MSKTVALAHWTEAELLDEFLHIQETVDPELLSHVYRTWNLVLDATAPNVRSLDTAQLAELILDVRGQVDAARRFSTR